MVGTFKDLRMKALDRLGTTANQHFKEVGPGNKYCESQNPRMWPLINSLQSRIASLVVLPAELCEDANRGRSGACGPWGLGGWGVRVQAGLLALPRESGQVTVNSLHLALLPFTDGPRIAIPQSCWEEQLRS